MTYRPIGNESSSLSYLQVFRNGILESTTSALLYGSNDGLRLKARGFVELGAFLNRARELMKLLSIDPPASLYLSILGARGAALGISERVRFFGGLEAKPFDRDNLLLRELFLMDWDGDAMTILKPLLNELWQASGFARCLDYTDGGQWRPQG